MTVISPKLGIRIMSANTYQPPAGCLFILDARSNARFWKSKMTQSRPWPTCSLVGWGKGWRKDNKEATWSVRWRQGHRPQSRCGVKRGNPGWASPGGRVGRGNRGLDRGCSVLASPDVWETAVGSGQGTTWRKGGTVGGGEAWLQGMSEHPTQRGPGKGLGPQKEHHSSGAWTLASPIPWCSPAVGREGRRWGGGTCQRPAFPFQGWKNSGISKDDTLWQIFFQWHLLHTSPTLLEGNSQPGLWSNGRQIIT